MNPAPAERRAAHPLRRCSVPALANPGRCAQLPGPRHGRSRRAWPARCRPSRFTYSAALKAQASGFNSRFRTARSDLPAACPVRPCRRAPRLLRAARALNWLRSLHGKSSRRRRSSMAWRLCCGIIFSQAGLTIPPNTERTLTGLYLRQRAANRAAYRRSCWKFVRSSKPRASHLWCSRAWRLRISTIRIPPCAPSVISTCSSSHPRSGLAVQALLRAGFSLEDPLAGLPRRHRLQKCASVRPGVKAFARCSNCITVMSARGHRRDRSATANWRAWTSPRSHCSSTAGNCAYPPPATCLGYLSRHFQRHLFAGQRQPTFAAEVGCRHYQPGGTTRGRARLVRPPPRRPDPDAAPGSVLQPHAPAARVGRVIPVRPAVPPVGRQPLSGRLAACRTAARFRASEL